MLIGIVGKSNVGKSTFFKAQTLANVEIANYPFTTIKPHHGTGFVSIDCVDKEFNVKCNPRFGYCIESKRFVPVELLDVAGLVPGAHEGKGMGNQFLDDLNQADALIHIIDVAGSTNEKGEPITPLSYDPADDIKFLEHELDMWYLRLIEKGWDRFARSVNQERPELNKAVAKQLSSLRVTEKLMEKVIQKLNLPSDILKWEKDILLKIATELRIATKPMVIACNKIDIKGADENFERLKKEFPQYILVPCSAEAELALREASKHGLIKYIPGDDNFEIIDENKLSNASELGDERARELNASSRSREQVELSHVTRTRSQLTEKQKNALNFIKTEVLNKYGTTGVQKVLDIAVFELLKYIAAYPVATNKLTDKDGRLLPDCFLVPKDITALEFAFKVHTDIGNNFIKAIDQKTKLVVGKEHKLKHGDVVEIVTSK